MAKLGKTPFVKVTRSETTLSELRDAFVANDCAYPTPLESWLYDKAEREGFEMVGYYCRMRAPTPERRPWKGMGHDTAI